MHSVIKHQNKLPKYNQIKKKLDLNLMVKKEVVLTFKITFIQQLR